MGIFNQLVNNKGTVSSALGKALAARVLAGELDVLKEAIELVTYNDQEESAKNIRAGAAKTVEIVAEKQPELVAPHLAKLYPALKLPEPQTCWMIIRTMGFCCHLNQADALKCLDYAEQYIKSGNGLCLKSSAELYLGDIGALSAENAKKVFPLLDAASNNAEINEVDWILEAYMKMLKNLDAENRSKIKQYLNKNMDAPKKSTQSRVKKLFKMLG